MLLAGFARLSIISEPARAILESSDDFYQENLICTSAEYFSISCRNEQSYPEQEKHTKKTEQAHKRSCSVLVWIRPKLVLRKCLASHKIELQSAMLDLTVNKRH